MKIQLYMTKGDMMVIMIAALALAAFSMAASTCAHGPPRIHTASDDGLSGGFEYFQ